MTDINFINNWWKSVIVRLQAAGFSIDKIFIVRSEAELSLQIKDINSEVFFIAIVVPSSDTKAINIDNVKEGEVWLAYVLEKVDRKGITQATRILSLVKQQQLISDVKKIIRADMATHIFPFNIRPDLNSMHSDPEDNIFGSEGYSLSFKVESDDFLTI